jgi:hypothetical protein
MPIDKYSHHTTELADPAGYTEKQLADTASAWRSRLTKLAFFHRY